MRSRGRSAGARRVAPACGGRAPPGRRSRPRDPRRCYRSPCRPGRPRWRVRRRSRSDRTGALVRVREDGVGLADLLEALLGGLVAGVLVGVVHPRELAVGLLQLGVVGLPGDAQDAVSSWRPPIRRCRRPERQARAPWPPSPGPGGARGRAAGQPRRLADHRHLRLARGRDAGHGLVALGSKESAEGREGRDADFSSTAGSPLDQLDAGSHAAAPRRLWRLGAPARSCRGRAGAAGQGLVGCGRTPRGPARRASARCRTRPPCGRSAPSWSPPPASWPPAPRGDGGARSRDRPQHR